VCKSEPPPDSSSYFRNAKSIRGRKEIDLAIDPAPELVIEVDISRSPLSRFRFLRRSGLRNLPFDGERVRFYVLERQNYREIEQSLVLPPMTASQAGVFVERDKTHEAGVWLRAVQDWIRARLSQ